MIEREKPDGWRGCYCLSIVTCAFNTQSIRSFPNQLMQASSSFSLCRYVNRNYGIKEIKSRNCQNVYQCELEIGKYLFIAFWLLKLVMLWPYPSNLSGAVSLHCTRLWHISVVYTVLLCSWGWLLLRLSFHAPSPSWGVGWVHGGLHPSCSGWLQWTVPDGLW